MTRSLRLDPDAVLAQGLERLIYAHPEHSDALVKIFKPRSPIPKWYKIPRPSKRRFGVLRNAFREYEEYIAALSRLGRLPACLPALWGFAETNLGIGMVVEKITDAQGNLAPSLHQYIEKNGLSDTLIAEAHALIDELAALRIIISSDLLPQNIVVGVDVSGKRKLVVVDGVVAEATLIRVKTWVKPAFIYGIEKRRRRLIAEIQRIADEAGAGPAS